MAERKIPILATNIFVTLNPLYQILNDITVRSNHPEPVVQYACAFQNFTVITPKIKSALSDSMSMKHHINQLRFIQIILLSICVSVSVYQCYFDLQALFKDSNGQDLRIFMQFTHDFTLTGQMYYRPSAEGGEINSLFRPTSPVLKFPPAFALQLISFTNQIDNHQFYFFARVIMLISYCVACISLMVYIMKKWHASSPSRYQIFFLYCTHYNRSHIKRLAAHGYFYVQL